MPRVRNDYQRITLTLSEPRLKLYVIAAEGDKTEYNYFTTFKKHYQKQFRRTNLHVEFLERPEEEAGQSGPRYVEHMIETFLANNPDYGFHNEYDEIWFILDTDEYKHRQHILLQLALMCRENKLFNLGLSNPSFELWLILHFINLDKPIKPYLPNTEDQTIKQHIENIAVKLRAGACKQLLPHLHQNQQPLYERYIARISEAIPRAKQLGDCDPCSYGFPDAICTSVYKLFEHILNDIHAEQEAPLLKDVLT